MIDVYSNRFGQSLFQASSSLDYLPFKFFVINLIAFSEIMIYNQCYLVCKHYTYIIYSKTAIQAVKGVWPSLAVLHKMARVKKL